MASPTDNRHLLLLSFEESALHRRVPAGSEIDAKLPNLGLCQRLADAAALIRRFLPAAVTVTFQMLTARARAKRPFAAFASDVTKHALQRVGDLGAGTRSQSACGPHKGLEGIAGEDGPTFICEFKAGATAISLRSAPHQVAPRDQALDGLRSRTAGRAVELREG